MTTYVLYCGVLITFEEISYAEYAVIKPYLIKEGE